MTRCGCAGSTCACKVVGSGSISVSGTGTAQDPYTLSLGTLSIDNTIDVDDTTSVDLTLLGSGTALDPFILSATVKTGSEVTSTPTNGGTTTVAVAEELHVFNHGATIAGHTVTLPATSDSLVNEVTFVALNAITALTVSGAAGVTVAGAPTTLAADGYFTMRLIGTVWRRVG